MARSDIGDFVVVYSIAFAPWIVYGLGYLGAVLGADV